LFSIRFLGFALTSLIIAISLVGPQISRGVSGYGASSHGPIVSPELGTLILTFALSGLFAYSLVVKLFGDTMYVWSVVFFVLVAAQGAISRSLFGG
jgi:hypothetical protein